MAKRRITARTLAAALSLSLMSCSGGVKESLGLNAKAPDEFRVIGSQPLVVPPEFRLPEPGAPSPASERRSAAAKADVGLLRGEAPEERTAEAPVKGSPAEEWFLARIGAKPDDAKARKELEGTPPEKQKAPEPMIDAGGERKRIEKAKKEGKPVTGEGAETYKKRDTGVLGKWLGW